MLSEASASAGGAKDGDDKKTNDVKVFVGNLDFKCTSEDLSRVFMPYGTVIGVNLRTDRHTGRPKGFGFVTFANVSEAVAAIAALHGSQLHGRTLTVNTADVRGSKEEAAKPDWLTTPTPRPEPVGKVAADPNVKDYSGMTPVVSKKKGRKQGPGGAGGGGGGGGGAGDKKGGATGPDSSKGAKLWTSWAGPA